MTVIVVWVVAVGAMLVVARSDVNRGVDRLESTQSRLTPDAVARGVGLDDLEAARADFASAHDLVGSIVVKPFEILPVIGRQVKSVDSLTEAASQVVDIGMRSISQVQRKLKQKPKDGAERIALLDQLHAIAHRALTEIHKVDLGPGDSLVGPVKSARDKFVTRLHKATKALQDADDLAAGLAKLLRGPSHYLVLAANNAEMRNGSGMLLSAGVMTIQDGKLDLGEMRTTDDLTLPPGAVPLPAELAALWGFTNPTQDWRNLATSARFDEIAPLGAQMWQKLTGVTVDGVLAIDPVTLAAIIKAEGPITVQGVQLNGDNVVKFILHDQYVFTAGDQNQIARRDLLSSIARTAFDTLDQRDWKPATLLKELSAAVDGRHFLAWSADPVVQRGFAGAGMAGVMSRDSLLVSSQNFSGNKLDQYVGVNATLSVTKSSGGSDVNVRVHLKNNAPADDPFYILGPYPGTGNLAGEYRSQVTFTMPADARQVVLEGATPVDVAGPDGPTQVQAAPIDLKRGEERDVSIRFHLPPGENHLQIESSARVPAIQWNYAGRQWFDLSGRGITW